MRIRAAGTWVVRCERAIAAVLCLLAAGQQAPVFRGGVDLVTVDVVVLDRSGAPVTTLAAGDFTVTAGGRARRIVAAEYITARVPERPPRPAALAGVPEASSNARQPAGRTFLFVIDIENILAGEGRLVMQGIAEYLDRLGPDDLVGLVTMPTGTPRVEPTTDRALVREALLSLAGSSIRLREREMTFGEAVGIHTGDRRSLLAFWKRILPMGRALSPNDKECLPPMQGELDEVMRVPVVCRDAGGRTLERWRYQTRTRLRVLQDLAQALAPLPAPKALVLVAGGLAVDPDTLPALNELSQAAERARVSVQSVLVEASLTDLGPGDTLESRVIDNQIGLAGLADIAAAARGASYRVQGEATTALSRIDRELSGYYLLSFERDPGDREGARVGITVRTRQDGLQVIARREFTALPAAAPAATDAKAAIGALLRSPTAVPDLPLDVDVYVLPTSGADDEARAILAVEAGRAPAALAAFGFQIADPAGAVVADGYEAPVTAQPTVAGRALLLPSAALRPGRFIVRVAALDDTGRGGSVQHEFEIPAWPDGPIRLSDLIFGDLSAGELRPTAGVAPDANVLPTRLVIRDAAGTFAGLRVRLEVTRAADGQRMVGADVPVRPTADPLRRFADLEIPIDAYPPGAYVVTAVVSAGGKEVGRRMRLFDK